MMKKLLPVGIASFSEMREMNYYYVDKTKLIVDLVGTSRFVFLSRPRRFGKSLTLDTIAELFSGRKELFKDLYAENHWDWSQSHPVIRFAMLTGVSKFGQMSLFSGLNHIKDITLKEEYSSLCGYTQEELEHEFAPELDEVDLAEVRRWYNGYNWKGESVYNPFDILLFFKKSTLISTVLDSNRGKCFSSV